MSDGTHEWKPQPSSPEWIAGRIGTLLDHYFQPNDPSQVTKAQMMDWIKVLRGLPQQAISASCDGYLRDQPRRRPTPGEIYNRANSWLYATGKVQRPRIGAALPKPERAPPDKQRAAEILERAGFTPDHFRAVQKSPMARDRSELTDEGPKRTPHWTETAAPDDPRLKALAEARAQNKLMTQARRDA